MQRIKNIFRYWLPLAAVIVALSGLVYLAVQQALRTGANDPQIQMAEDAAAALAQGGAPDALVGKSTIDVASSLAPFMIVYDDAGNALVFSGQLHGQPPALPSGVLEAARANGQDRISWMPEAGVRIAAVIEPVSGGQGGFVLAGRSLREVEKREALVQLQAVIGMLITLVVSFVIVVLAEVVLGEKRVS